MNKRNAKGRPITNAIEGKLFDIRRLLLALDRSELDAVAADLDGMTESNCGFLIYQQRNSVKTMVAEAISEQDRVRRMARASMGMESER